ncbi:thioesterase family protein [Nocardioides sp. LHD-245]|uniref:acyl-CoA thioesterase n=1 Tax=Nocardioides sp. LHD-245 TaxID=3051387 RepID=UPI0027DF0AFC|nr:thioesterase family protein [Nocardioides sp. LHD-245]
MDEILSLRRLSSLTYRSVPSDRPRTRLYGGEVAAQAMLAARATVPPGRELNSMTASFLRAGDTAVPVDYRVGVARDGGVFSARTVEASQGERPILLLTASFQAEERGLRHQVAAPDVPAPERLLPVERALAGEPALVAWISEVMQRLRVEVRFPDAGLHREGVRVGEPVLRVWIRARGPVGDGEGRRDAALVYLSDLLLLTAALEPHPHRIEDGDVWFATIGHSVVMHAPWCADDWLLYEGRSDWAGAGRCLVAGRLFDRAGRLCASTSQEGLLRVASPQGDGVPSTR